MRRTFTAFITLLLLLPACDALSPQVDDGPDLMDRISELRHVYSDNLSYLGEHLEEQGATLSDQEAVREGLVAFHEIRSGKNSETVQDVKSEFDRAVSPQPVGFARKKASADLPDHLLTFTSDMQEAIQESTDHDAFRDRLESFEADVLNSDWKVEEKEWALMHIVLLDESFRFLYENQNLAVSNRGSASSTMTMSARVAGDDDDDRGWWESWGRCAAGTVGGAGTVAIAGAMLGTSTGPFSPITVTSGAAFGAVVGGLSGAAASCGSGDDDEPVKEQKE